MSIGNGSGSRDSQFDNFAGAGALLTANICTTNIMDFRGFDSSIILISRVGILMSTGDVESTNRSIGTILVGRASRAGPAQALPFAGGDASAPSDGALHSSPHSWRAGGWVDTYVYVHSIHRDH